MSLRRSRDDLLSGVSSKRKVLTLNSLFQFHVNDVEEAKENRAVVSNLFGYMSCFDLIYFHKLENRKTSY